MKKKNTSSLLKIKYEEEETVSNAWSSELHSDIIGLISEKLLRSLSLCEYVRFGSVCFCWRSLCIQNYQHIKLPSKLPVLLIPISSPPTSTHNPSSSSSTDQEDDKEEEELDGQDDDKEEEVEVEDDGEVEEVEVEDDGQDEDEDEYEYDYEYEYEEEEEEDEDEDDDDEDEEPEEHHDEEPEEHRDKKKITYYYNPKDIWEGQDCKQRFKNIRNFFSLSEKMVYQDFPLPVPYYKNIRGSSYGWLVTVEECCRDDGVDYYPVRLLNPFRTENNNEIQLPPLSARPKINIPKPNSSYYVLKAYLSANPSSLSDLTELVVLAVTWNHQVSFCKPGDKDWTHLKDVYDRVIHDILCYQGQFYAILSCGFVFAFVFDAYRRRPKHIYTRITYGPKEDNYPRHGQHIVRYLVESNSELLQIRRDITIGPGSYKTFRFVVFKQDPMDPSKWVETKTLNDHMLFLGAGCTSMSVSALDFPGCKPNSIYYTDDCGMYCLYNPMVGPHDIGVFNVEDGSFEPHYSVDLSKAIMPSPVWIQPML